MEGELALSIEINYLPDSNQPHEEIDSEWEMRIHREGNTGYFALLLTDSMGDREWILPKKTKIQNAYDFYIPGEVLKDASQVLRLVYWDSREKNKWRRKLPALKSYKFCDVIQKKNTSRVKTLFKYDLHHEEENEKEFSKRKRRWESLNLDQGPSLLLLHGLAGKTKKSFKNLLKDKEIMDLLHAKYGDRIIGFDHPSIQMDPIHNADYFFKVLKNSGFPYDNPQIKLDILTRSRGGMVAKKIVEDLASSGCSFKIPRAVLLAPPLEGTPIANEENTIPGIEIYYLLDKAKKRFEKALKGKSVSESLEIEEIEEIDEEEIQEMDEGIRMTSYNTMFGRRSRNCSGVRALKPLESPIDLQSNRINPTVETSFYTIAVKYDPNLYPISDKRDRFIELIKMVFKDEANDGINTFKGAVGAEVLLSKKVDSFPKEDPDPNIHHESLLLSDEIKEKIVAFLTQPTPQKTLDEEGETVIT
ncbi:MAG: hypothetical protein AAGA10_24560 [Bacteroidota bacterium]